MPTHSHNGCVVVVGSLNVDLVWQVPVLPRPGQTILAAKVERQFGGKGANQAIAAARQGAKVTMIGAVGNDAEGQAYREHLRRESIDDRFVAVIDDEPTGSAHVYVDPRGENLIVVDQGANRRIGVAAIASVVTDSAVVLVQTEGALGAVIEALNSAEAARVPTLLNPSPVDAAFPWGQVAVGTVIVNEHECAEAFGVRPGEVTGMNDTQRAAFLAARRIEHLIITQGREETLLIMRNRAVAIPTFPVSPIDTVGAGDCFAGTLAAELAVGRPIEAAIRHANVAAALSTLALGAQAAMPTRSAVEAALRG